MSIRTDNVATAINYANERINADHSIVLVAFLNNDNTDEFIIAPIGSNVPESFHIVATLYWDDTVSSMVVHSVSKIN